MPKILIVEDNEKNRRMMRDILTYHGYEIIEAENGEEAIKMAKEFNPELILMDMQMPVMDGFAATSILKNDPETRRIKIIAVTSFAMVGDKEKILQAGADDYISKPLNTRELPERVRKILEEVL
ncbi:MAG: response regulator [Nitrospirae bacterium CG02_land_8_20_14_3_00_44_33]|nr:MAG: two-component system response regulator [Nitrospirae bacterium CG1_02_44_142]PIV42793.1 MAG: response regulator [Nitrospirae bacterium CG02_land_8_20_14_3_00_44_33]PIV67203.1 MAG: response regulator [Nitrospirae bacterium CG01_land_8_20_14_3_00_44_22]PIW89581.1 MAG: response regulator [Nitrospirae bacterium CG_4_8_14_3_um_filter_44_28]